MKTYPHRPFAPVGPSLAPSVAAEPFEIAPAPPARGIIRGILTFLRRRSSVIARMFDGIAEQRERQAKQIVAFFGQDREPDSLERQISPAHAGKDPELKLGAWHWH
jgi:hypothetical protein